MDPRPYVSNPGYRTPPTQVQYFFSPPAAYRTDDITSTDLALLYAIDIGRSIELFLRPEVLNVFNERGVIAVDTTVFTAVNQNGFLPFNPFSQRPARGPANPANPIAHYQLGPSFGQPTSAAAYQSPRTFRLSAGVRF